ncbi:putative AAA+ superfamily ATPase [Trueperella bonasi]|uniref:AAA+ superfamily ATPase n=1 Tax=Trueperella bonasi TaxID=312286 RepID=A0ABT9NGC4_9ACTO|nr:DUF4143 domain-containing protein [Trueperella bonasi]MDP9806456.1 putative AAA+ superfamily ATPase [Trueperella bonasi]
MLPSSTSTYLGRYIDDELDDLLDTLPGIAIDGPKGIGKTETAARRAAKTFAIDNPATRQIVAADAHNLLTSAPVVLIDEWQHYPPLWDAARRLIDAKSDTTFLFTGSATPIDGTDTHSGAGRIVSLRMRPFSLAERPSTQPSVWISDLFAGRATITGHTHFELSDYARAVCETGLPDIFQLSGRPHRTAIAGYVDRIIDRDIPDQGLNVRRPAALRAWLAAYAAASSTTASYTTILNAATPADDDKVAKSTALTYRDMLTKLWILDPVEAWLPNANPFKRLNTGPKHQLSDPGIAAHLLNLTPELLASASPGTGEIFGQLFESLAVMTIRAASQAAEARVFHLRTKGGEHEVDAVAERYDGNVLGFEVKLAKTVSDSDVSDLHWLGDQIGERLIDKVIITTGKDAYRRSDGVAVVPLALLG